MTRSRYPLEDLVFLKQKKLEEAEKILNEKKRLLVVELEKLEKAEKERDRVLEHKVSKLTQLREALDSGERTDKIIEKKSYLKVVDEQVHAKERRVGEQKKQVDAAEQAVETARKHLFEKQKDVEKLAMHRKEWDKEQMRWLEQQEAIETDEMGIALHSRKKQKRKTEEGDV